LAGGRDTVVNLISAAIWRLASYPDERARLAADLSLLPTALDELLRYLSPLPHMERKLTRTVDGSPSGSQVVLSFVSANHDPSVFSDPGTIDLSRRPNHHLAFGNGPHTCIGAHLGKLEARVFLEELLRAAPPFALADQAGIVWQAVGDSEVPQEFVSLPIALVR
jgi:cytochrome P450